MAFFRRKQLENMMGVPSFIWPKSTTVEANMGVRAARALHWIGTLAGIGMIALGALVLAAGRESAAGEAFAMACFGVLVIAVARGVRYVLAAE